MSSDYDPKEDTIDGVKIQRLPTYGRPLSYKTYRHKPHFATTRLKKGTSKSMLKKIVKALS